MTTEKELMMDPLPYEAKHHTPGTVGEFGSCSWHGLSTCVETPFVSFQDRNGAWQSGCQRAVDELTSRGEFGTP